LEDEDKPESSQDIIPEEADIEDDAEGIYFCCGFVVRDFFIGSIYIFILVEMCSLSWQSILQMNHFHQSPLERFKKLKARLDHFHHNCCMMMKTKKPLILKRTKLYW
jgi:hypothetical protein